MNHFVCSVPCLFGLEGIAAQELRRMDIPEVQAENGRVLFQGDFSHIIKANLRLRTGERVLLRLASFPARSFEELFQGVLNTPLEEFIPKDGAFPVKGHCLNSQLHSVPDCQAIIKKAAAKRLGEKYHVGWLPETGSLYQLQFSIMKDQAELFLDTTGAGLHKRGYRAVGNDAPLRETLAAALVSLSRYRGRDNFVDPFCGSGTIAIEAAMIAKNRAPGMNRSFSCQKWQMSNDKLWQEARQEALSLEYRGDYHIFASDIDPKSLKIAQSNAKKALMDDCITFAQADATTLKFPEGKGVVVTNPPYGQRMLEQRQAQQLLKSFGRHMRDVPGCSQYIISSEEELERYYGKRCTKKRKLYNGMIKCNLFMYY
jgi:putative N6-adenine-specific DNA methylase